jgi:hypothetical protein
LRITLGHWIASRTRSYMNAVILRGDRAVNILDVAQQA